MTTSTTSAAPATKIDLLALDLGLHADSLTKTAERFDDDADASDVVGAWLADGWIEQAPARSVEEIERIAARVGEFELASGDFEAIEAILDAAGVEEDSEAWEDWRSECESAAAAAWSAHWTAGVEAIEAGREDGAEHADDLSIERSADPDDDTDADEALADLLRTCGSRDNDWGTSSSEAWSVIGGDAKYGAAWKLAYCEAYEDAARDRCWARADEIESDAA